MQKFLLALAGCQQDAGPVSVEAPYVTSSPQCTLKTLLGSVEEDLYMNAAHPQLVCLSVFHSSPQTEICNLSSSFGTTSLPPVSLRNSQRSGNARGVTEQRTPGTSGCCTNRTPHLRSTATLHASWQKRNMMELPSILRRRRGNAIDGAISQPILWFMVAVFLVIGGSVLGYGLSMNEQGGGNRRWHEDPGFYSLLWQGLLQCLASYCSLVPMLRDRRKKRKDKSRVQFSAITDAIFYGALCLSICTAVLAPIVYAINAFALSAINPSPDLTLHGSTPRYAPPETAVLYRLLPEGAESFTLAMNARVPKHRVTRDSLANAAHWEITDALIDGAATMPHLIQQPLLRFLSLDHSNPQVAELCHSDNMICPENDELDSYTSPPDTLSERMDFLLLSLQSHVVSNALFSDDLNSLQLRGFFTADNFRKLIHALYSQRFRHLLIIHWPTFRPETISFALLLAAGMAGAAFLERASQDSTIPAVVLPSPGLLKTAEDYVFEELRRWSISAEAPRSMDLGLEFCQAALLMGTAVDFDNDEKTCERMANHRLPILVAALRSHGLPFARQTMSENPTERSQFIRNESWIRTVTWAFFSDTLKTMFYNIPPIMTIREMDISLPCSSELWYAETPESFELLRRMEPLGPEPLSLSTVVEDILGDEWDQRLVCLRDRLSVPHLHAVIMSLHLAIFNFHATMIPACSYPLLIRALDRWEMLWDFTQARVPQSEKNLLGVARHSHELAWLWRMIVEHSRGKTKCEIKYLKRSICYDTTDFRKFLQDIKS
ncbi:hypothetical protein NM208_g4250 [Fusarium decemcellulare]|uniref:Uncharacterized protein n=1 Tax=Fusarium decemcellulare TaxID=57161 RepID=A0ACC1SLA1_9HYPO|nr:hypothetical protein NM208_g4250 [Fusarium decemcellulare]